MRPWAWFVVGIVFMLAVAALMDMGDDGPCAKYGGLEWSEQTNERTTRARCSDGTDVYRIKLVRE